MRGVIENDCIIFDYVVFIWNCIYFYIFIIISKQKIKGDDFKIERTFDTTE